MDKCQKSRVEKCLIDSIPEKICAYCIIYYLPFTSLNNNNNIPNRPLVFADFERWG